MAKTTLFVVMPESAPVCALPMLQSYVSMSALSAFAHAKLLSAFVERENPGQALHHAVFDIFECEDDGRMRLLGRTAKVSDDWIVEIK